MSVFTRLALPLHRKIILSNYIVLCYVTLSLFKHVICPYYERSFNPLSIDDLGLSSSISRKIMLGLF